MTKQSKGAKSAPGLPPRHPLPVDIEELSPSEQGAFAFPPQHRLVITTTKGVYIWDVYGITEIFRSGSKGIVAAKRVASGGEMLAVADSEVVVLHEFNGGLQKSYRLKGSEGRVRLLKVDKESKKLFFTTTLQNSVQSYSIPKSKLLDPSHNHPSPPSVFAISCNTRFLLSTSVAPPTIYLTNLSLQTAPVMLRPYCSSSSVVAAAFHPENEDFFLLAFADGTAAVFDALQFFHSSGRSDRRRSNAAAGTGGEMAFIKGLHATGTSGATSSSSDGVNFDGYDPGTGIVGIGSRAAGITAVAFVPGRSATAVTVGADGKCCVVDFTQLTKHKAVLLKSWHVRRPATSLSIICFSKGSAGGQLDGPAEGLASRAHEEANEACYYIAIGRQDGRVLLFDLNGKPLGHQALDADGSRVIDVEWTPIEGKLDGSERPRKKARPALPRLPVVISTDKVAKKPAVVQAHPQKKKGGSPSPATIEETVDRLFDFSTKTNVPGAARSKDPGKQPPSEIAQKPEMVTNAGETPPVFNHVPTTGSHIPIHMRRVSESSANVTRAASHEIPPEQSPPPIPPRPSPKVGGRLSKRRAQTAYQAPTYLGVVSEARRMSSNPRVTGVVYGPRQAPSPKTQAPKTSATSTTTPSSSATSADPKDPEVDWSDVAPEPPQDNRVLHSPLHSPKQKVPDPPEAGAKVSPISSNSLNSFKTATSRITSEASDDTVVTWSAGITRRPVPTLQPTPQDESSPRSPINPERKGHISLSVSSQSPDTSTSIRSAFDTEDANRTALPSASPPKQQVPRLQLTHPTGEWPKQKGHVSIPSSANSTESQTPISADSDDQIVQWSSLRKSPRIPELHKGIPNPSPESSPETVKESVTGIVIKGYTGSPSPSKPPRPRPSHIPLPSSSSPSSEAEPRPCTCAATLEATLKASLSDLRVDMKQQFVDQRLWFEDLMRGEENERNMLAVENRWLRNELAKVEEEKGKISIDERGLKIREV